MAKNKGGRTEFQKGKEFTQEIASVAQVPGGLDMLMTMAAEELGVGEGGGSKQVRMFNMGGSVGGYGDGGLAQAAEMTRAGGRGDDEMLVHMSPEEYEAIEAMWGKADINPNTGIPEYGFLSKLWKKVKKTVKKIVKSPLFSFLAPIALNVFAPGLGSAIGGWLGATGKAAATIGNTIVRSGIGAISGGKDGAISGALSGLVSSGVGGDIGAKLGLGDKVGKVAGDALLGGAAGEATGVGFKQGALGQGMSSIMGNPLQKMENKLTEMGRGMFNPGGGEFDVTPEGMSMVDPEDPFGYGAQPPVTAPGDLTVFGNPASSDPSLWDRATNWMSENPLLTAGGALAVGSMLGGGGRDSGGGPPTLPDRFTQSLPNLSFDRQAMPIQDYYNYGRASADDPGEASFFSGNSISGLPPTSPGTAPPGDGPGIGGALQPVPASSGVNGMVQRATMQQQGWQFDGNMYYPPGWFGAGGTGPVAGAMEGGQVMAYRLGGLVQKYAMGGSAHVKGPGTGRSDDIPAVLSDGEYIIDSETVALLGDGSTDAGARRLDEMREKLRKHKGKKLAKGGFSDAARTPEEYMAKGGKVGGTALRDLKKLANRLAQAVESGNKKRVNEITAQLRSLDSGDEVATGLAKGGSVSRILGMLERNVESDYRGTVEGATERRLRSRRQAERNEGEGRRVTRLSKKERENLLEELGAFKKNSRLFRELKRDLAKEKEKT